MKEERTIFHAKKWFDDNKLCSKVYVFVVDAKGVNEDGFIADSHAVSTIHDSNCVASYVRDTYAREVDV